MRTGLPAFALVGLPDAAVRESRERVRATLCNSGFEFPQKRITANLAPADLRKAGPGFDLAIAAAVLAATEQLPDGALADVAFAGELARRRLDQARAGDDGDGRGGGPGRNPGDRRPGLVEPEAALGAGCRVVPIDRLEQLQRLGGDGEPPEPAPLRPELNGAAPVPDLADLRETFGLPPHPRSRRGRRPQPADRRSAGRRESMAARRLPSILRPSAPRRRSRRPGGERLRPVGRVRGRPPEGRAPHHRLDGGTDRRRQSAAAGRVTLAHHLACSSSTSSPSSAGTRWRRCASPLEDGAVRLVRPLLDRAPVPVPVRRRRRPVPVRDRPALRAVHL